MLLRHYLEQGLSKAEIARDLGISRRTVYHWIATEQLDRELDNAPVRYTPRPPVEFNQERVVRSDDLGRIQDGTQVRVAGIVTHRQRPRNSERGGVRHPRR